MPRDLSEYTSLHQRVLNLICVVKLGVQPREKILPDDAEFERFAESPAQAGIEPVIRGNRTHTSVAQVPYVPSGNVPVQMFCEAGRGAKLRLELGRGSYGFDNREPAIVIRCRQMDGADARA